MDLIERQDAIDALNKMKIYRPLVSDRYVISDCLNKIVDLPSAEPEIIRCKDCKHWTQSTGKMKGYGLGRCDFHDADLVTCNGFCYWAEGRTDG